MEISVIVGIFYPEMNGLYFSNLSWWNAMNRNLISVAKLTTTFFFPSSFYLLLFFKFE